MADLLPAHIPQRDDFDWPCCALPEGHEGACAFRCDNCYGSTRCPLCGDEDYDDLGTGCDECDGYGHCMECYEGMVTGD